MVKKVDTVYILSCAIVYHESLGGICPDHRQGPLHSFDEADLNTAQMALSTNPDSEVQQTEDSLSQSKLRFRRKLSDIKRQLQKVVLLLLIASLTKGTIYADRAD